MKETRELILETAYKMFLANNYESVTISNIIQATGFTKGAIYHYFTSKEELFKAVIDEYLNELEEDALPEGNTLGEQIEQQLALRKNFLCHKKKLIKNSEEENNNIMLQHIALKVAACKYYPNYNAERHKAFIIKKEFWAESLKRAIKRAEIKPNIDIEINCMNLLYIEATVAIYSMSNNSFSLENINELYDRQLRELYNNIKL